MPFTVRYALQQDSSAGALPVTDTEGVTLYYAGVGAFASFGINFFTFTIVLCMLYEIRRRYHVATQIRRLQAGRTRAAAAAWLGRGGGARSGPRAREEATLGRAARVDDFVPRLAMTTKTLAT